MLQLLILVLAGYGMASIIGFGKIFDKPRGAFKGYVNAFVAPVVIGWLLKIFPAEAIKDELETKFTEFMFCHLCIGFWVGLFLHFFIPVSNWFVDACMVSGTAYFIDIIAYRVEMGAK